MERVLKATVFDMIDQDIRPFIDSVISTPPLSCLPLPGGANNRVFKLTFSNQDPLILKRYFQHPQDPRQRLFAEYFFLQYAWSLGIRCIPQPLFFDEKANAAIYSFIPGKSVEPKDLSESLIQQTVDFFLALNKSTHQDKRLPLASESCFSIQQHLQTIEKRVVALLSYEHPVLEEFLHCCLLPYWENVRESIVGAPDYVLSEEERCISPSDFGFHNALLDNSQLGFIDFEYAGWDDPAKTVCDFFCQPRIPVPQSFFQKVSHTFVSGNARALHRIELLFPAYRIKWCCIILNCFSPIGQTRRTFAQMDEKKEDQLKKAKQLLNEDHP